MSISKTKENGKWRVTVGYRDIHGKSRTISRSVPTRKEAYIVEASLRARCTGRADPRITFAEVAEIFLERAIKTLRRTSISAYSTTLRIYLIPYFGRMAIGDITTADINQWKAGIEELDLTLDYRKRIFKILRRMFSFARQELSIDNDAATRARNFREDPNVVTTEREPLHFWTLEEFRRWMATIEKRIATEKSPTKVLTLRKVRVYIATMILSGMRKGEANALLVRDFHDGDVPYLSVTKSINEKMPGSSYLVTNPKTKSSVRDVPIPDELATMIREHVAYLLDATGLSREELFLIGGERPIPDSTAALVKDSIEREAGVPHIRIHDLRHSYVSFLVNAGTDMAVVSKLVGHSSIEITSKVYAHLYPKTMNSAVERLSELLAQEEPISDNVHKNKNGLDIQADLSKWSEQ